MSNGFGDSLTKSTGGMAVFGGYLCVGAGNSATGAQLWCSNDGANWAQVISPGFGDPNIQKVETVFVFQNQLYISVKNVVTGMEIWRSADGINWQQVNADGFGDSSNSSTNWSNATADFVSQLYVGTSNIVAGGELWRTLQQQPTDTPTATQTATDTPTTTLTPTNTATNTATDTLTPTDTPTETLTPTDTPTETPTSTSTNTPTDTSTATQTPTSTLTNTPTNTPTETPTPTQTPTDTPTSTPTPTPILNTPGKVTGGGMLDLDGGKATFGFTINYDGGNPAPEGNLIYQDHKAGLRLKATSFDLLVINENQVQITGSGVLDNGQVVNFTVEMEARSEQGLADTFAISIPALNGYTAGGPMTGGNITIHK